MLAIAVLGALALAADASGTRKPTAVELVTRDAIVTSGRGFELELRCPGSARSCKGQVTLKELRPARRESVSTSTRAVKKRRRLRLARTEATLPGGISTVVGMQLTKRAFKRVRRHGPLVARVVMRGRDATGRRVRLSRKLRIGVPARERPSLLVGIADDRIQGDPAGTAQALRDLNVGAARVTLLWEPGQVVLTPAQVAMLAGVIGSAPDLRIVISSRARVGRDAPTGGAGRNAYCGFLGDVATRFPAIRDFAIWLEPNKQQFWAPQFDQAGRSVAPRAYVALLARCWDVLHGIRADANVIGPSTSSKGNDRPGARSNVSHAPSTFIRRMGEAYRASGRAAPLLDTIGHHPYGLHSAERPWQTHPRSGTLGLGDWHALLQAWHDGFAGTHQPLPGGGTPIWYLESGFQTVPAGTSQGAYTGSETEQHPLQAAVPGGDVDPAASRAPDQATQLRDAIELAYCQPYVTALFNFLLYDEAALGRWQSGVYWADGGVKPSAPTLAAAAAAARDSKIRCSRLKGGPVKRVFIPKSSVEVRRIGWSRATRFNHKHDLWRLQLQVDEPASYEATIVPVRRRGTSVRSVGEAAQTIDGQLRQGFYQWIRFPRKRLSAGTYRIEVRVTSALNAGRTTTLDGPLFEVARRRG